MTMDEWFAKYFADEYVNVQDKEAWRTMAKAEMQAITSPNTKVPTPAPAPAPDVSATHV
jgi:hypothetical protein